MGPLPIITLLLWEKVSGSLASLGNSTISKGRVALVEWNALKTSNSYFLLFQLAVIPDVPYGLPFEQTDHQMHVSGLY